MYVWGMTETERTAGNRNTWFPVHGISVIEMFRKMPVPIRNTRHTRKDEQKRHIHMRKEEGAGKRTSENDGSPYQHRFPSWHHDHLRLFELNRDRQGVILRPRWLRGSLLPTGQHIVALRRACLTRKSIVLGISKAPYGRHILIIGHSALVFGLGRVVFKQYRSQSFLQCVLTFTRCLCDITVDYMQGIHLILYMVFEKTPCELAPRLINMTPESPMNLHQTGS
ncbi:unnamed protein product [Periconia digitata]|uniref:Uncharacterized protein n=1 Tax=Periconia digitata TaxID=1303443 RepID=A0A9W4U9V6_9PLEO|nr:unnamed protein product [Periconia digitata]